MKTDAQLPLSAGAGKVGAMLAWVGTQASAGGNINTGHKIVFVIGREEIESCDISRFMAILGPDRPKKELREMHASVTLAVQGYDDRPEELYEIPAVRRYFALLHKVYPCWLYMADPASPSLGFVIFSVAENVTVQRTPTVLRVHVPDPDMRAFFLCSVPLAAHLHFLAGICRSKGIAHLESLAALLNLKDLV